MVGKYDIEIYNNRVHYFLTVKRNITIVKGNSATGKTELIRLIAELEANGSSSGITLKCEKKCTVLTNIDWELRLSSLSQAIVFIDETAAFIRSKRFAELVKGSDNYFVIVTRDDLSQLPYSVEEIYGLRNSSDSSKYKTYKKIYNEMFKMYNLNTYNLVNRDIVITEDSNSGFQFFSGVFPKCESAKGKSNIYEAIRNNSNQSVLAIVDGAAFGSEIGKIMGYLSVNDINCVIYAPESFEYLILKSGIIDVPAEVLENTYQYADSKSYISWENYYTDYLIQISRNTIFKYSKTKLNENFLADKIKEKIKQVMPEQIR
ncbi:MAG: translation initiation factor 2 [Pseudobutyrivibrio sp.]|nr:translation initiation factor 2 [Pseudobutyrivibrio sp.]